MTGKFFKFKSSQFFFCILLGLLLTSCTRTRNRSRSNQLDCVNKPEIAEVTSSNPFENVSIDIGIDGSGSMVGFVSRSGTLYTQAIDSLSTLIGNRNIATRYWRIGSSLETDTTQAQAITTAQFLEAKFPQFYDCKVTGSDYPCVSSTLHQIYELDGSADSNEDPVAQTEDAAIDEVVDSEKVVKILITDLEPNQSAIAELSSRVSQELQKNQDYKAVLVGVRSEFNGNVFSAETGQVVIGDYSTNDTNVTESGRPFYLVMTGPEKALDEIINSFNNLPLDVSEAFRVTSFASSDIDVITLDKTSVPDPVNECTIQRGNIGRQRPPKEQANQWLILEQRGCQEETETVVDIWSEPSTSLLGAAIRPEQLIASNPILNVEAVNVQGDRLNVQTRINAGEGSRRGETAYLTLSQRDLDEAVWADWNSTAANPNGAKTQNLLLFVYGLREAVKGMALQNTDPDTGTAQVLSDNAVKFCIGIN